MHFPAGLLAFSNDQITRLEEENFQVLLQTKDEGANERPLNVARRTRCS